jgi:hypothetical protein
MRVLCTALAIALLAALLGGCSGDDHERAAATATPTAPPPGTPTTSAPPSSTPSRPPTSASTATASRTAPPTGTASATHTVAVTPSSTPSATGTPDAFVAREVFAARQLDYLRFATQELNPGSVVNAIAHMQRRRVDPSFTVTPGAVPADAWDEIFTRIATLQDTRDFDGIELVTILYAYADDPLLAPGLIERTEQAMLDFKFWYTEPTAAGTIDESYYWSENHQVLYHAIEYLIGQRYPDHVIGRDGRRGAAHMADAREMLLRWFDFRARFGFTEWHSNVYYQEDLDALLPLAEFADDPAIAERAAGVVDLLLLDLAAHTQRGNFGATHGRTYKKDKMSGRDDDTWNLVKLLFDQHDQPYTSSGDSGAAFFARASRYRVPEAIWRIARRTDAFVDRERMSLPLDEDGPWEPAPVAPFGYSFTDPRDLVIWWGMAALTAWPVVPLTIETINEYDLWSTRLFSRFVPLRPITEDPVFASQVAAATSTFTSFGLLKEVNTYTRRTADYLLSSAQDYRKGTLNGQAHAWQATFDADAIVFTQHPAVPIVQSTAWRDDPDPGYWTGEATMPRSAQQENVAIHIYAPQYRSDNPPPLDAFRYEPYTHAYVPQDRFDEVVQDGAWTFARRGDGYVALYSYRPTEWIEYDPAVVATNGLTKPFDLRASGGSDNVWIVECGRRAESGSFEQFRAAIAAAAVVVAPRPASNGLSGGFDVAYDSPSQGGVTFGWEAPLTVGGIEVPLGGYPRRDAPWSRTEYGDATTVVAVDGYRVELDFAAGTRRVLPPGAD